MVALKNFKMDNDMAWRLCVMLCLAVIVTILPDLALATTASSDDSPISDTLCTVVKQLSGPVGRGIATVAVVFVGIGLFLGKMSWGLAIAVGIGIAAIFGAEKIVGLLDTTGNASGTC